MALVLKDRVKETTTTTGTGTVSLAGATTGYQSFSAVGDGNTTYYCIAGQGTSEWEVGVGTYTTVGATLSRDTVLSSSNSGNAVDFSSGTKDVFVVYPASKSANTNGSLTSGRVPYATTDGLLIDSSNLTFNGTTLTAAGFSGPLNGTVGATSPAAGAFTTLTASSTATLNTLVSSGATLTGGTINGMAIGGSTAAAGAFTTLTASSTATLNTLVSSGATLTGGTINGMAIGGSTPAAGAFTTLTASSTATLNTLASSGATLTGGTINNMVIGGTTAVAATFTDLTTSGTVTLNGGTANGVVYLNGSKVATSGSALTFDGTNLGIGTSSPSSFAAAGRNLVVGTGSGNNGITIYSGNASGGNIYFADGTTGAETYAGFIQYSHSSNSLLFGVNNTGSEAMTLDASGNLGIGTTSITSYGATYKNFDVSGSNGAYITLKGTSTPITADFAADSTVVYLGSETAHPLVFRTSDTERARIDSSGNFQLGAVNDGVTKSFAVYQGGGGEGTIYGIFTRTNGGSDSLRIQNANDYYANAAACAVAIGRNSVNSRSINAGGTVNASGADYAEYMPKCGDFAISKGDVVGIDVNGKLTNVFADSISFCVKSTEPSYVGGDSWGSEDVIGRQPEKPIQQENEVDEEFTERLAQYEIKLGEYEVKLELERQKVDRIAFAGQVPVNVTGAVSGQYIIPVDDNGAIKGQAISNPTFEQYQIAVGKVIAIEGDGRARIIVKVA